MLLDMHTPKHTKLKAQFTFRLRPLPFLFKHEWRTRRRGAPTTRNKAGRRSAGAAAKWGEKVGRQKWPSRGTWKWSQPPQPNGQKQQSKRQSLPSQSAAPGTCVSRPAGASPGCPATALSRAAPSSKMEAAAHTPREAARGPTPHPRLPDFVTSAPPRGPPAHGESPSPLRKPPPPSATATVCAPPQARLTKRRGGGPPTSTGAGV